MKEKVFIYPTDTVWGIGGNIHTEGMAQKVNRIKGYEEMKPLSILFCDLDMLADYFQLELFDRDWLGQLFEFQATLGLPINFLKKDIPKEAFGDSSFVCVRVLGTEAVKEVISKAGAPVYTTSFNEKGNDPILESKTADTLKKSLCPDAEILGVGTEKLSGHSSTIIVFDGKSDFSTLRSGQRVKEIEKHIELLSA